MSSASLSRKAAVLEAVRNSKLLSPTIRDIQDATGIPSTSVVHYYLNILEKEGQITRMRNESGHTVARGILLVEKLG